MTKPRLLHLDDEPGIGQLAKTVAEACGYEVRLLRRPEEFREVCRAFAPDLLLLDLGMPGTDGIEVLGWLAEEARRVRVLLLSGYDAGLVDLAVRLGRARGLDVVGALHKPLRLADLQAKLVELRLVEAEY